MWNLVDTGPSEGLEIRGCQHYLVDTIYPPWLRGWDRDNRSAKIWLCHGTPGTPRDDRPETSGFLAAPPMVALLWQCHLTILVQKSCPFCCQSTVGFWKYFTIINMRRIMINIRYGGGHGGIISVLTFVLRLVSLSSFIPTLRDQT